jgi:hypothetical protein
MGFALGYTNVHQTLAVRPGADGGSGLKLSRGDWYA